MLLPSSARYPSCSMASAMTSHLLRLNKPDSHCKVLAPFAIEQDSLGMRRHLLRALNRFLCVECAFSLGALDRTALSMPSGPP